MVGHAVRFVSRGLRAPRGTQDRLLGRQKAGRMVGANVALSPTLSPYPAGPSLSLSLSPSPSPQPLSIPQEPSGFTTNNGQYVPPRATMSPTAPGEFGVTLGLGLSLPWAGWVQRPHPVSPGFSSPVLAGPKPDGQTRGGDPAPAPQRLQHQQPPHWGWGRWWPAPRVTPVAPQGPHSH